MRKALKIAEQLCYRVERVKGTGEYKIQPEEGAPFQKINIRKKAAPRSLTVLLMQLNGDR